MLKLASAIDALNGAIGKAAAYLVYFVMAIILYEIAMRSLFNRPTAWVHDASSWALVLYIFLGGAWALQKGYFVRVDILHRRLPARIRALIDLAIGTALMAAFAWAMIFEGYDFGMRSFASGEIPISGAWPGPVWLSKLAVPIGTGLLALAWLSRAIRAALALLDPGGAVHEDRPGLKG